VIAVEYVKTLRRLGLAKRPRKVLPRQIPPIPLEREYAQAILALLDQAWTLLEPLRSELPELLRTAAAERQDADEGRRIRARALEAARRIADFLTPERLEELAIRFARRTAEYQKGQLSRQVRAAVGADVFIADRTLETRIRGFAAENAALISSIPRELADKIAQASTRAIQSATPAKELANEISNQYAIAQNRAKIIARDQVGKLYGQLNAARQKELGAERFVWRTVHDARVRPEHVARDGNTYSYASPPAGELPGEPILCRCYAEPVFSLED
jgi:SPP1 gp7 family putative phage head morphogenesis protein